MAKGPDERFAANVRALREAIGWNQSDFALVLSAYGVDGMHQTTISRIEAGDRQVKLSEAIAIAKALRTTVEALANEGPALQGVAKVRAILTALGAAQKKLTEGARDYNDQLVQLRKELGDPQPLSRGSSHSPFRMSWDVGSRPLVIERVGWEGSDQAVLQAISDHDAVIIDTSINRTALDIVVQDQRLAKFEDE